MMIRYVGKSTVRELGQYVWNAENGYLQDVTDPQTLEEILTYPKPDFEVADSSQ